MKINHTIVTTIEIEPAERKLLSIEYKELCKIMNKKPINEDKDKFSTIHELIQNILD